MKIIKNVRSSEKQEKVKRYGNETHVLVGERQVDVEGATQYEYDKVIVNECMHYANVVENATKFYNEEIKKELLDNIVVTVASGKKFYGDPVSRADLSDAIKKGEEANITSTPWKLAEAIDGEKIQIVTIDELREARDLALEAKGAIIGVQ